MSRLTLAIRNLLVQDPDITSRLGRSTKWPEGWVFDMKPYVAIENKQRVLIVVSQQGGWSAPNSHNTMKFPRIAIDVWADPTRNDDNSVSIDDADDKIVDVLKYVARTLNKVNLSAEFIEMWGTADEIASKTGVPILASQQLDEVELSPMSDGNGARMGRVYFGITTFDTL